MAKFLFDLDLADDLRKAQDDQGAAIRLLVALARYLKEGKPVPSNLAGHLTAAIDVAVNCPSPDRVGKVLAQELGIARKAHRPAAADWIEVGEFVSQCIRNKTAKHETDAIKLAVREFAIKPSAARTHFKRYVEAREEHDRISDKDS